MPEAFAIKPEGPSSDDRWIIPGSDLRPPIKNSWALYMDPDRDDPMDLRTAAATIMKEWAGITSLDGRIFSGREQRAMDPREYYKLAIGAFKAGSLTSLFSEEWAEFHEAEGKGDKAGMRALANAKIKGEGVGAKVASAVDRNIHNTNASELGSMRKALGTVRDVMSPEDIDTLEHPYRLGLGYVQGVTGLYEKYHEAIEDERRVERYRKQLADENQWAVIESIKPHVSDNARKVLEMALQSADEPTNSAVMKEFEKLSTPEMRSIAGALQALHYDRDPDFKALCADAGRAFCNTLGMVTVGAVRGATDLVRRTWMDSAEYRDMVDRRVMLEDANRERMADWGIVGNAVIGAASTIPYMAAAAIPYVGMADMFFSARDEFQSQAARNGVDVSSLDFILGSSAFAIAYAYVEKIQWEKAFGGLANFSRRQMYCDVFHSVRAALGVAGAYAGTVLTESGEEGIQAALEEAATHWGLDQTLAGEVKAFTEDFVGSLGTMAIIGAFGGAKQGIAYRHGALAYDKADAMAAQSRILELDRHMAGHPGEVGPLAAYGRTYGRMVEDWIEAGTDVGRRQASLMRWGLTKEQAGAIHGALQSIWSAIEGSDASAERKAEQKSALIGGGHVLTPGEMIASIQNGDYRGKIETRADGSQAVDLSIAGKTLRMVVQPKREAARIDENDTAMFESIVNELNDRNFVDADGAQFTVEGWKQLDPEERRTIIDQADLAVQGNVTFEDMDGNRLDGRVLDAITGQVHMTDEALPQTAFHETMHGVLRILTDMARGEKDESGAWKVEPDSAAAALVGELGTLFKPRSDREAVDEERLSNAFQQYLTGKIRAVEHTGLFDRLGRFLARLFGYGGRTYEIENARTAHERLFNTAITGHIAQALQGAESVQRPKAPAAATEGQAATAAAEGQEPPTAQVAGDILGQLEADYPELAPLAAMFRNRDPLDHQQMAQLAKATGERLTTDMVWAAGYRWNGVHERWEYDERLERTVDDRDRPQQPFRGADGEIHAPTAEGPSSAPEGPSSETEGTKQERNSVAPRIPSPEFAMDGTIVDALPAHLREDARDIIAERAGTPRWMTDADGTQTELNERDWLRREAEQRHGEARYSIHSTLATGRGSTATYVDSQGVKRTIFVERGTRKHGMLKVANKHCVDYGTAWTGGFTLEELERYEEKILKEGERKYNKATGNLTFKWKSPEGVTFTIGAYAKGKGKKVREVVNTVYTDRTGHQTKMLGTNVRGKTRNGQPSAGKMPRGDRDGKREKRFAIAGRIGAERLGIRGLGDAEAMDRSGATREDIWRETGWWRGKDGKWRVEIPDITLSMDTIDRDAYQNDPEFFVRKRKLADIIGETALFDAYPYLRNIRVQTPHSDSFGGLGTLGDYNGRTLIRLNMSAMKFDPEEVRATLAHEIQHAIQHQEQFAEGANVGYWQRQIDKGYDARTEGVKAEEARLQAQYERQKAKNPELFADMEALWAIKPNMPRGKFNPDTLEPLEEDPPEWQRYDERRDALQEKYGGAIWDWMDLRSVLDSISNAHRQSAYELYHTTAGEVEARNVEKRLKMTPEERAATPPWKTEDVDAGSQIVRFSVAPSGAQKRAGTAYPDAGAEIGDQRFAVGTRRRADYKALLEKKRPDLDAEKVLAELDKFNSPKKEKAALHWTILGTIQLPQDEYKVDDALSVAAKAKVDPLKYRSPLELIEAHREFKPTRKPIDPDTVPELDGKMDGGDGITIYVVEDSRAGQLAMRRIIDTHWGEDANPWCLLEREKYDDAEAYRGELLSWWNAIGRETVGWKSMQERPNDKELLKLYNEYGGMEKAWKYWNQYSALPKLVAFKNGKLLAFMATEGLKEENDPFGDDIGERLPELQEEYDTWLESEEGQNEQAGFYDWLRVNYPAELEEASVWEEWWDRMDESHPGLEWARDQRYSITSDALAVALDALLDGGKIDIRIAGDKRDAAIAAAKDFHARYGEMRLPISTGRTMFFAPSRESVARHGGDEAAAWAEYALHAVTNDNVDKSGKHYRAFSKEKIEKVMPRIPEIVAADMTAIDKNRVLFFYELDERHIARLVAQPENGNLRVDDLVEVTATYAKGKTPGTAMPLARAIAEWTSRGDTPDSATVNGNQPQPDADGKSENARGSVAGRDPGWWDAEGQADAAAREARDAARYGLSFGGPSFSHRSYVEAFAARDRALGFKRTDEDYKRLIDAFGLTGKMTVADAKSAGEALQAEMHGAAATLADLVKQAEKKNFRKTVDRMIMGAAGYGIEVGANAHRAWAEYVSRMRRLAQGGNAQELRTGWGLDFAAMLFAAGPEGFEAKEQGKAKGGGEAVAGDDEAAALEGALIDGREGELGFTAEEAKARLAELLEAKKGDVAARNARLRARLEEWRKQEEARQAALLARQEAEAARKAEKGEKGEKDGDADRDGDGKGDRPQERDEEEAVAEMPDFQAFIKALQEDGWDLSNPGEFAAVLRFYVEDWLSEKYGVAPSDVMKDPVAAAQYRKTVLEILRDACNQLLDPNDGQAVRIAERMLGEIPGDASAAEIEARSRSIIGFIKRNAIRQSRKKLVAAIIEDIKKLAIQGRMFDETEKDIGRKITGERESYAWYVARILLWGDKRIADEMARLNDIISGRLDAYRASRAEDAALEDLQRTDREIHRATERLAALQLWGGLRKKSPAEIALAGRQIHQWLETERNEHEKRWGEWKAGLDRKAEALAKAFSASRADYTPDDPGFVGELADGLTTNFKMRLERMAVGSGTEGRQAIEEVMMLIYGGSERLGVLKAARRERTDAMLERCVEGTGTTVGDFRNSLDENIPEELNRQLVTEEQPVRMTWGQALQLLGSLEQTASYAMNIEENGREGHRDLILAAVADKPQMLRLLEELRKIYEEDREAISQEFFAVTGNPILSPDPLYLPARMYTGARDNLETSVRAWNPFGPAFTPRIRNKRDFDLSASIMDVYNARMKETATALAFGMRGMELRSILARKSVQEAIARTHGKFALRKMIAQLTDIVSDGYKGDGGQMEWHRRAIRTLGDITTYSALSWNAVTMLKQMTSIPAWTALLDGGYGEIFRHITNFDAEAARELCRSPGFVARYGATGFGKMFRQELENPQGGNVLARLFKAGMTAVQMGDFVPGILVGTGVYKARKLALMNRGMGEGAAREQAARETWGLIEENQQSSRLENTPEILRRGGFIGRQLSKFATSPMMQVAHEMHTLRMWIAEAKLEARHGGKESSAVRAMMNVQGDDALRWRRRFVNQVVCNHVLMPAAMYAIAAIFKRCLGGEPPDREEIYGDLVMQMVAGPWSRIFLVGAIADQTGEWVARMAGGKPNVYARGDLAATQHLHKALVQVGRIGGDVADMDWASVRDDFVKMVSSYNAPFRYAATAVQNAAGYDPAKARRERKKEIRERKAAVGE